MRIFAAARAAAKVVVPTVSATRAAVAHTAAAAPIASGGVRFLATKAPTVLSSEEKGLEAKVINAVLNASFGKLRESTGFLPEVTERPENPPLLGEISLVRNQGMQKAFEEEICHIRVGILRAKVTLEDLPSGEDHEHKKAKVAVWQSLLVLYARMRKHVETAAVQRIIYPYCSYDMGEYENACYQMKKLSLKILEVADDSESRVEALCKLANLSMMELLDSELKGVSKKLDDLEDAEKWLRKFLEILGKFDKEGDSTRILYIEARYRQAMLVGKRGGSTEERMVYLERAVDEFKYLRGQKLPLELHVRLLLSAAYKNLPCCEKEKAENDSGIERVLGRILALATPATSALKLSL